MKRERINDDEDTDGLAFRHPSSGIKYRVINVKQEKTLTKNLTAMPANLSSGGSGLNNEDSQSGEEVLSMTNPNSAQSFININGNTAPIYFMLPNDSSNANQSAIMARFGQPEVCLLNSEDAEVNGMPRRGVRDDKRRATHNEIERRRRGKINSSIDQLANVLPGSPVQNGSKQSDSKGAILSKACEYIEELKDKNDSLHVCMADLSTMKGNLKELSSQILEAREQNRLLRERMASHGIHFSASG